MASAGRKDKRGIRRRLSGRYCDAGDEQALQDDVSGALAMYQRATELDADNDRAYIGLGDVHVLADRDDRAMAAYRKALAKKPNSADAHFCIADLLARGGQLREAIYAMEEAVDLAPERAYYLYRLADLYVRVGDVEMAEEALLCAISIDPDEGLYRYKLGELHVLAGDWVPAAQAYFAATQCAPLDDFYHVRLMSALMRLDRRPAALKVLRRTCRIAPDNRAYRYLLGELLVLMGELEAGSAELRRAGKLDYYDQDYVRRVKRRSGQLREDEKLVLISAIETHA
ncbi:MAG: tetratricopeptide repeat protein [Armatimonadia bacterium]|nr:tetratricopeptide repeat protein [Armatimonadia bacterium]